jgi:hypothetical protein
MAQCRLVNAIRIMLGLSRLNGFDGVFGNFRIYGPPSSGKPVTQDYPTLQAESWFRAVG